MADPVTDEVEDALHEFLLAAQTAAPSDSIIKNIQIGLTAYDDRTADAGVMIGDGKADLAPNSVMDTDLGAVTEWDAELDLVCFARIEGEYSAGRGAARKRAKRIARKIAFILVQDPTLNGFVTDSRALSYRWGNDSENKKPWAVAIVPFRYNETGQQLSDG